MIEDGPQYRLGVVTNYYPEIIDFMSQNITGLNIRSLDCKPDDIPKVIRSFISDEHALCMLKASFPANSPNLWCDTKSLSQIYGLDFKPNTNPDEKDKVPKNEGGSICVGVALIRLGLITTDQLETYKRILYDRYATNQGNTKPIFRHALAVSLENNHYMLSDQYGEVLVNAEVLVQIAKARKVIDPDAELAVLFLPKDTKI